MFSANSQPYQNLSGPQGQPLFGNLWELRKDHLHQVLESWAQEFGAIYKIQVGSKPILVLSDTELIHDILSRRPHDFSRRQIMEEAAASMGINGIFTSNGDRWQKQRRLTVQAFDTKHIHEFFPVLVQLTDRLKNRWMKQMQAGQELEIHQEIKLYTIDVMSNFIFGYDINSLETTGDQLLANLQRIFPTFHSRINSPLFAYWKYFKLPKDYELERSLREVYQLFAKIISDTRQRLTAQPALAQRPQNLVESMLAAQIEQKVSFSDKDIFANAFSCWLAGEDAVSNALAWVIHFITADPAVQNKIQAEVAGLQINEACLDPDQLPYIQAVISESLRLKPAAPIISVQANHTVEVAGRTLPPGQVLLLLPRVNALQSEYFDRPTEFWPDRWLPGGSPSKVHQEEASMPFGGGSRHCAGSNLALLEMKLVIAMLGQNFQLAKSDPSQKIGEEYVFLMAPDRFKVKLSDRSVTN